MTLALVVLTVVSASAQPTYQQALENELYAQRVQVANYMQQLDNALYAQRVMANSYYGYGYYSRPVVVAPVVPVRVAGPVTATINLAASVVNLAAASKIAKAEKKAAEAVTVNNVPQTPVKVIEAETIRVNTLEVKSMSVDELSKILGK